MFHLLNSAITLADFDVIIKELHKSLLGSEQFLAEAKQILRQQILRLPELLDNLGGF